MGKTKFCLVNDLGPFISDGVVSDLLLFLLEDFCTTIENPSILPINEDNDLLLTDIDKFKNFAEGTFDLTSLSLLNTKTNKTLDLASILEVRGDLLVFPSPSIDTLNKAYVEFLKLKINKKKQDG